MRRLILFDVDGTLLSARGAPRRAFERAMLEVYQRTGPIATHRFDGKTDPQIARELLELDGLGATAIDAGLPALWRTYLRALSAELETPGHETHVYPGVHALLQELERRGRDAVLGLLTGNIRQGALLKLASARIATRFRLGAFGCDCERRDGLPPIAVARALAETGVRFDGESIVIVGDTPHDVSCGAALGVRAIAVATGRHERPDLEAAGASVVFDDFRDTAAVLDAVLA